MPFIVRIALFISIASCFAIQVQAQQQTELQGTVVHAITQEPIPNATVEIMGMRKQSTTDSLGKFSINLAVGLYNIKTTHLNYYPAVQYEIRVDGTQENILNIALEDKINTLDELTISAYSIQRSAENGTNLKTLEIDEIQRMPGAVMDISKVIKALPGVVPRVSFGYAQIVRGGGSSENSYYLDGIKIPAITHFNVQGLSGGPNGAINTDLISKAVFRTGAFPVQVSNTLSSSLLLEQKTGRQDRWGGKVSLGAAEYGLHLEGPISKYTSLIFSARKSYTEHLLKAFNLPVLPAFMDFQFKQNIRIDKHNQLDLIGLATSDKYRLYRQGKSNEAFDYNVGYIPEGDQATQTYGMHYKHLSENSSLNLIASMNYNKNNAWKFFNNSLDLADLKYTFNAKEYNYRFRAEHTVYLNNNKLQYGASINNNKYSLKQSDIRADQHGIDSIQMNSNIAYKDYAMFFAYSLQFNSAWNAFLGLRLSANDFGDQMKNPLKQISPRLHLQYRVSDKIGLTLSSGIYYQMPDNLLLAYRDKNNKLVNKTSLLYIRSNQISLGLDYKASSTMQFNTDVFYKQYSQYPFLVDDQISLANYNGEYVAIKTQTTTSTNNGHAYGIECYLSQKLKKKWFYSGAVSYVISSFENENQEYVPSSWDSRIYANITLGKSFKKHWTLGAKFTFSGATPYTPYDTQISANKANWDINRRGVFDYNKLNTERLSPYHSLDIRVDKKWFFKRSTILLFLDLQNLYNNKFKLLPYLTTVKDEQGNLITDANNPDAYALKLINSDTGRVLPTIGFSVEF